MASGKFWSWSVTWDDVQLALDGKLETNLTDCLDGICFNAKDALPPPLRLMFSQNLWSQHAVATLIHWLGKPCYESSDDAAIAMARHAGATAFRMIPHPTLPALEESRAQLARFWNDVKDHPCERPARAVPCGTINGSALMVRYWWPSDLADAGKPLPPSPGFAIFNEAQTKEEPTRHLTWRRWLWLFNIFQTLPGVLLATQAGLEAGDHCALTVVTGARAGTGPQAAAHASAWEEIIKQSMLELGTALRSLMDKGFPPPNEVGYEFEENGEVVAEAELAWTSLKVVLLMPTHGAEFWISRGWKIVIAEGDWTTPLIEVLKCRLGP